MSWRLRNGIRYTFEELRTGELEMDRVCDVPRRVRKRKPTYEEVMSGEAEHKV